MASAITGKSLLQGDIQAPQRYIGTKITKERNAKLHPAQPTARIYSEGMKSPQLKLKLGQNINLLG